MSNKNWVSVEDKENITFGERYSFWKDLSDVGEKLAMFSEFIFMSLCLINLMAMIDLPEIFKPIEIILVMFFTIGIALLAYVLVEAQRVATSQFVCALGTDGKKDDYLFGIVAVSISVIIIYADLKGGTQLLNLTNSYTPEIGSVETDVRVKSNDSQRKTIEQERAQKDKALVCSECIAIRAKYESKITSQRSNIRKNENGIAWKVSENNKIRNGIAILQSKRDAEIAFAEARFQEYKNNALEKYDSRLMSIDTMQIRVKASIDSSNFEEKNKEKVQLDENKKYGGWISYFTQFLLLLCRTIVVLINRKDGKSYVEIGGFMRSTAFMLLPLDWIKLKFRALTEYFKIRMSIAVAKEVKKLNDYKEAKSKEDETIRAFIKDEIRTYDEGNNIISKIESQTTETPAIEEEKTDEKILKKDEQNIDNTSEKDIILGIIKAFEIAKDYETTNEGIEEIEGIIKAFTLALDFIQ